MEVILKKYKITSSILNQTLYANVIDLETADVLGFCVHKDKRWTVLYNSSTNKLRKYYMVKEVIIKPTCVEVNFYDYPITESYPTESESESQELVNLINTIKTKALACGQFFI